jgi:8-oxo-dGTP diphosphatase
MCSNVAHSSCGGATKSTHRSARRLVRFDIVGFMSPISHDSETPAQGQQVITACALIHHTFDGVVKVFLPKRADTKKFLPGIYELPGGHIDFGENIVDGLKRELREEFEIDVAVGDPFAAFDYTNHIKGSHSVEIIYFVTLTDPPEAIKLHSEDHSAYEWISKDEIHKVVNAQKGENDVEIQAIQKAFDLLAGSLPDFAGS